MGMVCELQALTEKQIEAYSNDDSDLTWLDVAMAHYDKTADTLFSEPLCEQLTLDKSWAIVRFLLLKSGGSESYDRDDWSNELLYGELIGGEADYGGPHLRSIEETQEFADFLRPLTLDQVLSHFNWQEMREEEVYLVWEDTPDEAEQQDLREYAGEYFLLLREYVLKAAASRCGLLLWVN